MRPARLLCLLAAVVPGCGLLARESCTRDDTDRPGLPEVKGGRVFANIFLVIHCRWEAEADPDVVRGICEERRPLFRGFRKVFADVLYMTSDDCPNAQGRADPGACLADLVEGRAANRDGLFYMHFDALIKPRHLGINFNKNSMYNFAEVWRCPLNAAGRQANCSVAGAPANKTWDPWQPWRALQLQGAIQELRETGVKFRALDNMTVYVGNDDLFYLPRSVFSLYVTLAKVFERHMLHHEAGGPTMRQLLNKLTYVQLRSMDCTGSCCKHLGPGDALSPQFRCGHAFNLTQAVMRDAVTSSIVMQRDAHANSSSFGHWRELLDAALA